MSKMQSVLYKKFCEPHTECTFVGEHLPVLSTHLILEEECIELLDDRSKYLVHPFITHLSDARANAVSDGCHQRS